MEDDRHTLPTALAEAHGVGFHYQDGDGVDFVPYPDFLDAAETAEWWRGWTANSVAEYLWAYLSLLAEGFGPWEATEYPDHEHPHRRPSGGDRATLGTSASQVGG